MYKKYSDSTLLSLPKKELLLHLRAAEHNRDVAEQTLEQQAKNMKDWMPVRHGKWIRNVLFAGTHTCSNCLKDPNHFDGAVGYIEILSDYCPNCGAKMDEVSE